MASDTTTQTRSVSRRRFLQGSAVAGGAISLGLPTLRTAADEPTSNEKHFYCVCRPNCDGYCAHDVTVRDGKVVLSRFAPLPDPAFNRICLRGMSNLQRLYNPDRIKYPMKRVGERGEDKWEQISWEEAVRLITDSWKKTQAEYGEAAVAFYAGSGALSMVNGSMPGVTSVLHNAMGATKLEMSLDAAFGHGFNRCTGGSIKNDVRDYVHAKTIIVAGFNVTESNIHYWHFLREAQEQGAKLIVIDPVFTHIAARADQFIPCRPGSDPALLLGMMNVIVSENLTDQKFLREHTVAPVLVRDDNGTFLRMSDLGVEPEQGPVDPATGQPTPVDPPVVWDGRAQKAAALGSTDDPSMEGSFEAGGIACRTAYTLLLEEIDAWPVERAAAFTEIPAETIIQVSRDYADGPSSITTAYGNQAHGNGVMVGHTFAALAAITGNIGKPGASAGNSWQTAAAAVNWAATMPEGRVSPPVEIIMLPDVADTGRYGDQEYPIKSLYIYQGNPFSNSVDQIAFLEKVVPNMDLIVTTDLAYTDTVRYSDIVLPATHYYEAEEITNGLANHPYVQYSEQAVEPLFEAKPDMEIARLLAEGMGLGKHFQNADGTPISFGGWVERMLDTDVARSFDLTWENLQAKHAIDFNPPGTYVTGKEPWIAFKDGQFLTPTGRLEFYVEHPTVRADYGQSFDVQRERLPRFYPPIEAWPDNPLRATYPLVLLSERPRFRVHSMWFDTPWLRELDPEPIIKINPLDASARGIANGDYVEVFNERGHAVARAVLSEGLKPGVLTYPKGWQRAQHKAGHFSELSSKAHDPVGVNMNFFDVIADIRIWEGA